MKKYLLTLFLLIPLFAFSQQDILPIVDGKVTYTNVVSVENSSKEDLYLRAKKWFVSNYRSAQDVIQLDDKENGEIIGKGIFRITYYSRDPNIRHTVSILVKDNRYKYIITDLLYEDKQSDKFPIENFPRSWAGKKKLYETIDYKVTALIKSIELAMITKPQSQSDW